jgi:hypothetical protein
MPDITIDTCSYIDGKIKSSEEKADLKFERSNKEFSKTEALLNEKIDNMGRRIDSAEMKIWGLLAAVVLVFLVAIYFKA